MEVRRFLSRFLPGYRNAARTAGAAAPVCRPPRFRETASGFCGGCTACRDVCPSAIIVRDSGLQGPYLDFSQGRCTLCYLCAGACPKGVLTMPNEGERTLIGRARLIRDRCLVREGCSICIERCPEGALTLIFGRTIRVSKRRCTGCGGCRHACPAKPKAMSIEPLNGRP